MNSILLFVLTYKSFIRDKWIEEMLQLAQVFNVCRKLIILGHKTHFTMPSLRTLQWQMFWTSERHKIFLQVSALSLSFDINSIGLLILIPLSATFSTSSNSLNYGHTSISSVKDPESYFFNLSQNQLSTCISIVE